MTVLCRQHEKAGAVMGEIGGLEVPLHYGSPIDEASEAAGGAGIFDVTHTGRVRIRGTGALDLLEKVCTSDVIHQEDDTAQMTLLCNERAGIIDICCLIRLEKFWVLTCSAGNLDKVIAHLGSMGVEGAKIEDQGPGIVQLAVTGPAAESILDKQLPIRVSGMARGAAKMGSLMVARYIAARIGPTSAWTLEVMIPTMFAARAWEFITVKAGESAIRPCGMVARDILRLEAGLPMWGHELNETVDPVTAGLMKFVDADREFIGSGEIRRIAASAPSRRRVALESDSPAREGSIPRLGTAITDTSGSEIGAVTSAAISRSGNMVAQGYLSTEMAVESQDLIVGSGENAVRSRATRVFK